MVHIVGYTHDYGDFNLALAESGWEVAMIDVTGLAGAIGATCATLTFIPQVWRSISTKSTKDLSMLMLMFAFMGNIGWFVHGVGKESIALMVSAILIMLALIPLIVMKAKDILHQQELLKAEK